jgi:nucleoside-triphosphatase THEP1
MVKIFVCGLSGSGKDTISNYLRDEYKFLKLRIAGTIKQIITETDNIKWSELDEIKRNNSHVRLMHQKFGDEYLSSLRNRLKLFDSGESRDFEIISKNSYDGLIICDAREIEEVEILFELGWTGIFLDRLPKEFNNNHRSDKDIFIQRKFINLLNSYADINKIIILNDDDPNRNNTINEIIDIQYEGSSNLSLVDIDSKKDFKEQIYQIIDDYIIGKLNMKFK